MDTLLLCGKGRGPIPRRSVDVCRSDVSEAVKEGSAVTLGVAACECSSEVGP